LYGGYGHQRYEFSNGSVVGKVVSEREFLAAVQDLLDAAADLEMSASDSTGADVQPSN
jgi:hypothetical protein